MGFPAFGRTIDAGGLEKILFDFLPKAAEKGFFAKKSGPEIAAGGGMAGRRPDGAAPSDAGEKCGCFVANGSILPRKRRSDQPMKDSIPFVSPKTMEASFVLPHHGEIRGMAVLLASR